MVPCSWIEDTTEGKFCGKRFSGNSLRGFTPGRCKAQPHDVTRQARVRQTSVTVERLAVQRQAARSAAACRLRSNGARLDGWLFGVHN
jgi:hypothetical protein